LRMDGSRPAVCVAKAGSPLEVDGRTTRRIGGRVKG
jgi:hypothetical protein